VHNTKRSHEGYGNRYAGRRLYRGTYGRPFYGANRGYRSGGIYPAFAYGGDYSAIGYRSGYGYPQYAYSGGYPFYGYGPRYRQPRYGYGDGYGYACGNPTAGVVVGGLAGAAIGSQIAANGPHRYSRRNNDRTTGALIGGALGAAVGSSIVRGNC
jgi:hypothetical protein